MNRNSRRIDAKIVNGRHTHHINIPILNWQEDGLFYVYAPSLDLTGYGNTAKEADDSFTTTLTEFVKYIENKGTMYTELQRLGWTVNEKKKRVHPPEHEQLLEDNETFRELSNMPGVISGSTDLQLALA